MRWWRSRKRGRRIGTRWSRSSRSFRWARRKDFVDLRRAKGRETLRIGVREVAGGSTIEQTTLELTCIAELCLREVCGKWMNELGRRWGRPQTDFCVVGMGKFGVGPSE